MKISDIITLGKMGYTKKDIEGLTQAEESARETESGELADNIAKLQESVDNALKSLQVQHTRETVTEDSGDPEANLDKVQESLKLLMGVESDGEPKQQTN